MRENTIYISGFFSEYDLAEIARIRDTLHDSGITLQFENLNGVALQSVFEYSDFDLIAISYTLLTGLITNGMYDFIKLHVLRLWNLIKRNSNLRPEYSMTITIKGIPTENGPEAIKCKIRGHLSDAERDVAVDNTFALAKQIEEHQFELQKLRLTQIDGHFMRYDTKNKEFYEVDPLKEVHQIMQSKREGTGQQ